MVTFYIKDKRKPETSIRCSVQPKGMQRFHFTVPNSKIKTQEWERGRMKTGKGKQTNSYIQNDLNKLREKIENFYFEYYHLYQKYPSQAAFLTFMRSNKTAAEYLILAKKVKLVDYIKEIIARRVEGRELYRGKRFSLNTVDCYNSLVLALEDFQTFNKKKHYYVDDFTSLKLIQDFQSFINSEKKMSKNTVYCRLKTLKTFLQIAVNEDVINFNPFKKYKIVLSTEESDTVVFTEEELRNLEALDFSDNKFYDQIRDQYLLYIWSGARKSDFKNFLSVINPTTKAFTFRSSKTGEPCEIPAFDGIHRVMKKYDYTFPKPIHETIVLREIKNICKLIPSMNITVEKKYTKGGIAVRELKKKYEMVCIHTARRTIATLLVENGVPDRDVMKLTGHKKLTTFQMYVKSQRNLDRILEIGNSIGRV